MLFALAAVAALLVVVNIARQRVARREDVADDRAAFARRARVRELRSRRTDRAE